MGPTFLFLVLSFFMNGLNINGREMKVVDSYNEKAYIASYQTFPKSIHNHPSHHPYITSYKTSDSSNVDQPYITGYKTIGSPKTDQPYITGYTTIGSPKTDQPYITGYTTTGPPKTNQPYITGYRTTHSPKTDQPYITGYRAISPPKTHDTNQPYITGYTTTGPPETDQPYITGYRTTQSPKTDQPYITGYRATGPPKTHDTNQPYITSYGNNEPYVTQYSPKKDPSESFRNDESYITQYGETGHPKKSSNVDHTDAFKTGFFALDDIYVGNVMTLQFPIQEVSHFLPRKEADSIPFSMSQLPSVLQLFSVPQDSPQANAFRGTIETCEGEPITGETKTCVTSLESMLEFVATIFNGSESKNNILTTSYPSPSNVPLQKYTILKVSEDVHAPKWVACHPLPYPYAIHYCHYIATGTKVFKVSLGGENGGNEIEALGICYLDTSDWCPDHIIFWQLGFNAGQVPVCHFFPVNHILWVPQPSKATM